MGKEVIREPFAVINADDFYGRDSFAVIGKFLSELPEGAKNTYCMVGFRVGNTLSESGTVARGICSTDENRHLTTVVERTEIMRINGVVSYKDENGEWVSYAKSNEKTEITRKCIVLATDGNVLYELPINKAGYMLFGNGDYIFAEQIVADEQQQAMKLTYMKKTEFAQGQWQVLE